MSTRPGGARAPDRWSSPRGAAAGRRQRRDGLTDSKLLTAAARDGVRPIVALRGSAVVVIPPVEVDRRGCTRECQGMRRAVAGSGHAAGLHSHRRVPGRGSAVPRLAVWKGDQVAACVAAASVIAKVTRDRMMVELHASYRSTASTRTRATAPRSTMRRWRRTARAPTSLLVRQRPRRGGRRVRAGRQCRRTTASGQQLSDDSCRATAQGDGGQSGRGRTGLGRGMRQ